MKSDFFFSEFVGSLILVYSLFFSIFISLSSSISRNDRCSLRNATTNEYELWAHKRREINNVNEKMGEREGETKKKLWYTFVKLQQTHSAFLCSFHFNLLIYFFWFFFLSFCLYLCHPFSDFSLSRSIAHRPWFHQDHSAPSSSATWLVVFSVPADCVWWTLAQSVVCTWTHFFQYFNAQESVCFACNRLLRMLFAHDRDPFGSVIDATRLSPRILRHDFIFNMAAYLAYGEIKRSERPFTPFSVWWWCINSGWLVISKG